MKKLLLFLSVTILSIKSFSQISFQKGYYIDNENQKVDCLIKNIDWENNPTEFEYKLTESANKEKKTIKTVKEFGIYNVSKYCRYKVKIDRSSNNIDDISTVKKAVFQEEEHFLKVLLEGKASLYSFDEGKLTRYFFSINNSKIEQLIFKKYLSADNKVGTNNKYKNQLWNHLKCSTFKISKVKNVDYKKKDLVRFFEEYNKCNSQEFINFEERQKKDLLNLNIRPGFNSSSLSVNNTASSSSNAEFDNELRFRFGIEVEFIMPFNKNKWSLIIEPTYQHYKSENVITGRSGKVDYKSIEIPVGIRHYLFLNKKSKVFINSSVIFDLSSNSNIDFTSGADLEFSTINNLAFGVGYKYNDKYSLEFRYHTSREVLNNYVFWSSDFNTLSIILGYSLF